MTSLLLAMVAGVTLIVAAGSSAAQPQEPPNVRSEIRNGQAPVGYEIVAQRYGVSAAPELIEMVNSPEDAEHWVKAAGFLGVVGDERAVDALINLIERPVASGGVSQQSVDDARKEALRALGGIVYRTGNERALEYLIESLDDTIWRRRGVLSLAPNVSYELYDKSLSIYAIFGLALSGHPRGGEALRSLQQSPTLNQARLREGTESTLNRQLDEVYRLVRERGIAGLFEYYEERRKESGIYPIGR